MSMALQIGLRAKFLASFLFLCTQLSSSKIGDSYWIDPEGGAPVQEGGEFEYAIDKPQDLLGNVNFIVLKHKNIDPIKSWKIGVGKGSQIYSIKWMDSQLIGAQISNGIWIDRVLQTVAVSTSKNSNSQPYFIHQAGTYIDPSKGLTCPFWSPILGSKIDEGKKSFYTLVWPQQAHVYDDINWTSKLILQQKIRDMGDGIIEITYVYTNFGEDRIDFIDFPWSGFSKTLIPYYVKSVLNGGWTWVTPVDWIDNLYSNTQGNGWFAMLKTQTTTSEGLGVVYGKSANQSSESEKVRWGPVPYEDLTVLEAMPGSILAPGKTYFMRYYLMFGQLQRDLHIQGNRLANYVDWGELSFSLSDTDLLNPCQFGIPFGFTRCDFFLLSRPVLDPLPILLLRNRHSGKLVLSTSPYALSLKPYQDRNTEYLAFLGWGIRYSDTSPGPLFVKLGDILTERSLYPDPETGRDVWVYAEKKLQSH